MKMLEMVKIILVSKYLGALKYFIKIEAEILP